MKKINDIKIIENPDKISSYFKAEYLNLIFISISGILYNASMVIGPILQGKLIDSLNNKDAFSIILKYSIIFISTILIVMTLRYIKRYYVRRFANNTSASMRFLIFNNLLYSKQSTDDIGTRMVKMIQDVDGSVEGMRKFTTEIFDTGVLMIVYIFTLLNYDFKITIICLVFLPVAMFIAEKMKTVITEAQRNYKESASKLSNDLYQYVDHIDLYRVHSKDDYFSNKLTNQTLNLESKAIKANIYEGLMQPIYQFISMIGIVFVIYFGALKVQNNVWSIGIFSTYISIFIALAIKTSKISKLFNSIQKSKVSFTRIKQELTPFKTKDNTTISLSKPYSISFDNVSFNYGDNTIFKDLSFTAKAGEIIGISGPVACGKSTLGKVLYGNLPYNGSIKINNNELKDLTNYQKNTLISYKAHNPYLLSDTIENNIKLYQDSNIDEIIKGVALDKDFENIKDGMKCKIGYSSITLSGGQQDRIATSRALAANNPIVVLDDPFSSVDPKVEDIMFKHLREAYPNRIIFLISHRLKHFTQTDQILLMNSDSSVTVSKHEDLMKTSSIYQNLYNLQNGGINNEIK